MTSKTTAAAEIEETGLVLPQLLNAGLSANDRLKYYLTLLQAARTRAQQPQQPSPDLRSEREASGITDSAFDDIVAASREEPDGQIRIPGAQRVRRLLLDALHEMLEPLELAARLGLGTGPPVDGYRARLDALIRRLPAADDDRLLPADVDALMHLGAGDEDSVHQLVVDLHRELNHLQAAVFRESVAGAKTYGLTNADRELVAAFMKGVNDTAALKFDHPGLGTTATRTGDRLSIQNDLGTTDAHVVVVHIRDLTATLIYSDVHPKRVSFFQDLLVPCGVTWESANRAPGAGYVMAVGHISAGNRDVLAQHLTRLGSRLVFLIDWNRARKYLKRFVKNTDAIAVLHWAADEHVGHAAFVQAGHSRLIYAALERAARAQLRYGARLDEILGAEEARSFLMAVLRITSEGKSAGRSLELMQDQIEAELVARLPTMEQSAMALAAEHAMLMVTMAERLRHALLRARTSEWGAEVARTAELCTRWEARANDIVSRSQRFRDQRVAAPALRRLIPAADEAADALEEYAFLLTLLPGAGEDDHVAPLARMADIVGRAAKEYVRCLEDAQRLPRPPVRSNVEEILVACDRIAQLGRESTAVGRAAQAQVTARVSDCRELHVMWQAVSSLHHAVEALVECAVIIRDYALAEVSEVHE